MNDPIFDRVTPYPTKEELDALINNREVIDKTADKIITNVFGLTEDEQIEQALYRR